MDFVEEYECLVGKNYNSTNSSVENDEALDTSNDENETYHELLPDVPEKILSLNYEIGENSIENRQEDVNDEAKIQKFYENDINCCARQCTKRIPKEVALMHRFNFLEMDKKDQDLAICSQFEMHRRIEALKNEYAAENIRQRSKLDKKENVDRHFMKYFFADLRICRNMYFFLHDMTLKRYKNLMEHYDERGLNVREHKLWNKIPTRKNVITAQDVENIVKFLKSYAAKVAIPLPGRLPQFRNFAKVVKLPSCDTKASLYRKFVDATESDEVQIRNVSRTTFHDIWNQYCPHITTMKPVSDLCDVCRQNHLKLTRLSDSSAEDQAATLKIAMEHLETAQMQRELYNSWSEKAESANASSLVVLSFDYAQYVSYPSSPQQVGSSYFKANRKGGLFGIHNEATHVQTNIVIDEEDNTGKGANAVISMLHYYLSKIAADNVVLFSDNCVGQNKNNALLHYLLWRVMTGKNKTVSLNFLLTGHTKFSPDRNFGIIKSKYAKSVVDCQQDFIEVIKMSSPNNHNVAVLSKDPTTKIHNVSWAEWDTFLKQHFRTIPSLTKYHHFTFNFDGQITAKFFSNSPEVVVHEKTSLDIANGFSLKEIKPNGLSPQRAWYLYDEIRHLCFKQSSQDFVAPKPLVPRPKKGKL